MRALVLLVALVLASAVPSQQATYTYINQPGGNPGYLTALSLPSIGTTFRFQVRATSYSTSYCGPGYGWRQESDRCFVLFGLSNPSFYLGTIYPGGVYFTGFLFSSGEVILPTPQGPVGSPVTMSLMIPRNPALLGQQFYQQVIRFQSWRCYGIEFVDLSRGGHAVVGL